SPKRIALTDHVPSFVFWNWKASVIVLSTTARSGGTGVISRISTASGIRVDEPSSAISFRAMSRLSLGAAKAAVIGRRMDTTRQRRRIYCQLSMLRSVTMRVRALFFASLKDIVGSRELSLEVADGSTISDLLTQLESNFPRMKDYRSVILT